MWGFTVNSRLTRPSLPVWDGRLASGLTVILLAAYTFVFTGTPENPDSEVEYQTTSSLARNGRLAIETTPEAELLLQSGHGLAPGGPGREGRFYSWYGVGQAISGLPFWWVGHGLSLLFPDIEKRHRETTYFGVGRSEYFEHLLVGWRNPLLTALTAWLLVKSARRLGASRRNAWIGGLSYGLCTFAWAQARSTLATAQGLIAQDSQIRFELEAMLRELRGAARSIRLFADYLERHPEALIQGKGGP